MMGKRFVPRETAPGVAPVVTLNRTRPEPVSVGQCALLSDKMEIGSLDAGDEGLGIGFLLRTDGGQS